MPSLMSYVQPFGKSWRGWLTCYGKRLGRWALLKHETRSKETAKQRNRDIFYFIFLCVKQRNRDFSFQLFGSPVSSARATSNQLVPRLLLLSEPEMRLGTGLARSMDGKLMDDG